MGSPSFRRPARCSARPVRFDVFKSGLFAVANSFPILYVRMLERGAGTGARTELVNEFVESLDHQASTAGTALLTSEFYAELLVSGDQPFLVGLEQLARVHRVRVAWYVRPQHTALEARWREWGYRGDQDPASFIRSESRKLHHDKNLEVIKPNGSDRLAGATALPPRSARCAATSSSTSWRSTSGSTLRPTPRSSARTRPAARPRQPVTRCANRAGQGRAERHAINAR